MDYYSTNNKVAIGDQLTCKNMRGAKLWQLPKINPVHRLQWVNEVPGNLNACACDTYM